MAHCRVRVKDNRWAAAAILIIVTAAVYSNTLFNGFVYDDNDQILRNIWMTDPRYIYKIFTTSFGEFLPGVISGYYRPMTHMVYMGEYALFGLSPWGYHLVNILLQCAITVLVFLLSLRLIEGEKRGFVLAFAAAFYFTLHPAHSEVVAWLSVLSELCFSLLALSSFYLYTDFRPTRIKTGLSVLLFFTALFFKETTVVLILLIPLYDLSIGKRSGRPMAWKKYSLYLAAALLYFIIRRSAMGGVVPAKKWFDITYYQYLINIIPMVPFYFYKLVLPINLNAYYYIEPIRSILVPKAVVSSGFIIMLAYALYRLFRYDALLFFALAWVIATMLPPLYLPALGKNFFSERYLYLPSVGFCLFAALAAGRVIEKHRGALKGIGGIIVIAVIVAAASALAAGTITRNSVWRSDLVLWEDTVKKSPAAALPHYNLGVEYANIGETDRAIREFEAAAGLDPANDNAFYNLAVMYERKGIHDRAVKNYKAAISINPGSADAHLNLGLIYMERGLKAKAIREFKEVLRLERDNPTAREFLDELTMGVRKKTEQHRKGQFS